MDTRAGVGHGYTSKLELGHTNPTIAQLTKYAQALRVPIEQLVAAQPAATPVAGDKADEVLAEIERDILIIAHRDQQALGELRNIILAVRERVERASKKARP